MRLCPQFLHHFAFDMVTLSKLLLLLENSCLKFEDLLYTLFLHAIEKVRNNYHDVCQLY